MFLVVLPMRPTADQREARYTFKLLPLGNVFGFSSLRPPPTRPASIRTLELEHFRSGACWRPQSKNGCCHLRPELNVSVRKLRSGVYSQSPELGDWLLLVKILFLFTLLPSCSSSPVAQTGCSAAVHTLPPLPTTDAAESPASAPPPPPPASWRSCHHVRLTSTPNALDPYPVRAGP